MRCRYGRVIGTYCMVRDADIVTRPSSLLYVQALKFLETRATPAPARRARKARRVKRATDGRRRS